MPDAQQHYDVVVVGGGPAGLAGGMFTARRGLETLIVTKDLGGQLALTEWIENYPGVLRAGGRELSERLRDQVARDGAALRFGEAVGLERVDGGWRTQLAEGESFTATVVILAFGLTPNNLDATGEAMFRGKGLYYSSVLDAPKQDGKRVAVVGGGSSAVSAALELAARAEQVTVIHRRGKLRAEKTLLERLATHANVDVRIPYAVADVRGRDRVEALSLIPTDAETGTPLAGATTELPVESVFVQIGYRANTGWLNGLVERNARHEVVIDRDCQTSAPGIFAAGDVTDISYKQAVISAAEGVKAALQAYKFLQAQAGKPAILLDWDARGKTGAAS